MVKIGEVKKTEIMQKHVKWTKIYTEGIYKCCRNRGKIYKFCGNREKLNMHNWLTGVMDAPARIDYYNSLMIDLLKVRLSPFQTVLNASARLTARLPRFSNILSLWRTASFTSPLTPPALNLKFFSLFLLLNSVQLLNTCTFMITSQLPLSALSVLPIAMIYLFLVFGKLRQVLFIHWFFWLELPPFSSPLLYSLPLSSSLSRLKSYSILELKTLKWVRINLWKLQGSTAKTVGVRDVLSLLI